MSDSYSEFQGDIATYERLCEHYGVDVKYKDTEWPDCYGHGSKLAKRWNVDFPNDQIRNLL